MKTKLTLTIEEGAISHGKEYASVHDTSLSEVVERYLASLPTDELAVPPDVQALIGIANPTGREFTDEEIQQLKEEDMQERHLGS